jgi:S-adenosylmethionine-diacylgycerolhomoserine-N-methlytransferase
LIAAARCYPSARFYGIDVSPAMLTTARGNIAKAGLSGRIVLAEGDGAGFEPDGLFGVPHFDRVFFSYSLSMIPDWRSALRRGLDATSQGGCMQIVDFGQQEGLPAAFRSLLFAWLRLFHVTPRVSVVSALGDLAEARDATFKVVPLRRGYAFYVEVHP